MFVHVISIKVYGAKYALAFMQKSPENKKKQEQKLPIFEQAL